MPWSKIASFGANAFGSSIARYALIALITAVVSIWGVGAIKSAHHKITNYDELYEDRHALKQELADVKSRAAAEILEIHQKYDVKIQGLEESRKSIDDERKAIQKRAFIEAGKLKSLLEENEDAQTFHNIVIDDSFKQLRCQTGITTRLHNQLDCSGSTTRGDTDSDSDLRE